MENFLAKIGHLILTPFVALVLSFSPTPVDQPIQVITQPSYELDISNLNETVNNIDVRVKYLESQKNLGASLDIPTSVALFETSLAARITSSASTMTLVSAIDKAGTTLASSTYAFIIDEGASNEEMVIADCTGTACTNMTRGISPLTGTTTVTSLQKEHRRGASVKITDGPQLMILTRILNGIGTIPNLLTYKTGTACTVGSPNQTICDKAYTDGVAVAGASNANDTTKGIIETATAIEQASSTSAGSTAALLVLRAANASSTPLRGCDGGTVAGALCAVIAMNNGKINLGYMATSSGNNYNWGGIHTFASTTIGGVSSTTYSGATVAIDWSIGQTVMVQLNQSSTITFSNVTAGTAIRAIFCQDGTGSRTVSSWPTSIRWQTGFAPTLTTTANKCDIISFLTGSSTTSVFGAASANF